MNWPAMLIFMLVFYGVLGYGYNLVGEASNEDVVPIKDVQKILFEDINEDWFSEEYHMSDEYNFRSVNAPQNLSEGERVTISGEIEMYFGFEEWAYAKTFYKLRIKLWDCTRGDERQIITRSIPWCYGEPIIKFRFDGGEMPSHNYYYVIELYEQHKGVDIGGHELWPKREWLKEKFGGVIEGDKGNPTWIHYRERSEQVGSGGWINGFVNFFRNAWDGFEVINDSPIGPIINIIAFIPLAAVATFMAIVLPARIVWGK